MNTLGVYFGPQFISIVETKGNKTINYIQVSQAMVSTGEPLEEKVPVLVKLIALFKDELRKNNIGANEAIVSISGKDLIVRYFEMPILPRQELDTAVNFEVKKYIPFKIEDLFSDFQYKLDKTIQKTRVLFVGIKKETLDNYLNIFGQLDIKIKAIEYSAFSILRLLKLANIKEKGIIGLVNTDLREDDETNFVVLKDGFPLFSRDISLMGGYEEVAKEEKAQTSAILEKLKREIQISLDYYDRKFPGKNTSKIFFITNPNYRADLNGFIKDLGLGVNFIDINKYIGKPIPFSLPFVKGYSSSLSKIDTGVKINLLAVKERAAREFSLEQTKVALLIKRYKSYFKVVAMSLLICVMIFIFGEYRISPLKKELKNIIGMRPQVSTVGPNTSYAELTDLYSTYKLKIEIDHFIKSQLCLTEVLDVIPRLVPEGIWLSNIYFKNERLENRVELNLGGIAYLGDSNKEVKLVDTFRSSLKEFPLFAKYFKEIVAVSLDNKEIRGVNVTSFLISCRNFKK